MESQQTDISWAYGAALPVAPVLVDEQLLAELERMKRHGTPVFNGGDATVRALAALFAFQAFAPFWSAFVGELGKQLGETTTEVMHRIRLRCTGKRATVEVHGRGPEKHEPEMGVSASCMLQLDFDPDELSDDARLAMLEIDFDSPYLHGKTLRWSPQAGAWIPVPPRHSAGDQ